MAKRIGKIKPWWEDHLPADVPEETAVYGQPRLQQLIRKPELHQAALTVPGERLDAANLCDAEKFPVGSIIRVATASRSVFFFEVMGRRNSVFAWRCVGGTRMGRRNVRGAVVRRGEAVRFIDPPDDWVGTSRVEDLALILKSTEPIEALIPTGGSR